MKVQCSIFEDTNKFDYNVNYAHNVINIYKDDTSR